jgi:hypothetical protein
MKSKDRFLKVKEEDDSEKGSYWYLNTDEVHFQESIENAFETAEKLEMWVGIVYYRPPHNGNLPQIPKLFSDDEKGLISELYILDGTDVIKYKTFQQDVPQRKKGNSLENCRPILPLPPPPLKNLILICEENEENDRIQEAALLNKNEKKRKSDSSSGRSRNSRGSLHDDNSRKSSKRGNNKCFSYNEDSSNHFGGMVGSLDKKSGLDEHRFGGPAEFNKPNQGYDSYLESIQQGIEISMDEESSGRCDAGVYPFIQYHFELEDEESPETPSSFALADGSMSVSPASLGLFNENDDMTPYLSNSSLLFGNQPSDNFALPMINMTSLDIESLIKDPSVPMDPTSFFWEANLNGWQN